MPWQPSVWQPKSDLSTPACARLSAPCLCSVDLGQEDLVVLNLTTGTAAVSDAAPLGDWILICPDKMKQFLDLL